MVPTSRAGDSRHCPMAVLRTVAERHCLERHAVAARYFFWDVGASSVNAAPDATLLEGHGDQGTQGGYAASGDAHSVFDCGPDGDAYSCVWSLLVSLFVDPMRQLSLHKKSPSRPFALLSSVIT